ncbi:MAG: L-2-amino-thiazoline-4-carboxylic acid hydrolase, partial [Candidatus Heimdallarchaeota archaeon]|nr:L-2-amino-thiazoline-4-carboxylic acid hydrolase [Candidatus Heimdallarchaeota archaeon]
SSNFSKYIKNLELKFKSLINKDILSKKDLNIDELLIDFDILKEYPELAKNSLTYFLQILQLSEKDDWIKEKVKVLNKNYLRSFLIPKYYHLQTLAETIGRKEAIQLYKFYVTKFINDNLSPKRKIFDTMEAFKEHFEMDKKEITVGWYGLLSGVKDGKFFFRKDNCLWAEALMDLPDTEIKYLICCYGDFQAALTRSNDSFVLTMKNTIVEGDPYCDCIIHDTSIDWDLTHPSSEFWDNLKPIE